MIRFAGESHRIRVSDKEENESNNFKTLKKCGATEQYIKGFINAKYKTNDIFLAQLDYEFITELEHFIRHNPIKTRDPCMGNGVMKHLERFKKMVNRAKQSEEYQVLLISC